MPRARVKVLRFFAGGEIEVGVRELARALKMNAGNVQRELAKLTSLGYLVKKSQSGGVVYSKSKRLDDLCKMVAI